MYIVEVWKSIHYKPGFYDPSAIGWVITAAYFLAVFLCLWTGWVDKKLSTTSFEPTDHRIWFFLAGLMSFLGINKQLDLLQTVTLTAIRGIEIENRWSRSGRLEFQTVFVVLVVLIAVILFSGLLWLTRKNWRRFWLVLAGLALVVGFVAIRTASFNYVSYPFSRWRVIGPVRMKYVMELTGVLAVGAGAYFARLRR